MKKGKVKSNTKRELALYLEACCECLGFSGSVLVHRKEKPYLCSGFGKADREHNVKNKPSTVYRLASLTKQFTAMGIMMLVDSGDLKLNDKMSRFLSKAPDKWKEIRIHHLLTHTAGLPNYTELPEFHRAQKEYASPQEIIDLLKKYPMEFTAGKDARYTDSGFTILGHIIELVSGQLYGSFLENRILNPLSMFNTGYDDPDLIIPNRARGYVHREKEATKNAPWIDMSWPHAAGALCSTVEDLYTWDRALKKSKLIPKALSEIMFKPVKDVFACGWMVDEQHGRIRIQHAGGIDGFSTAILRFPNEDACVIVLSNVESSYFSPFTIAENLASILFHEEVAFPEARK